MIAYQKISVFAIVMAALAMLPGCQQQARMAEQPAAAEAKLEKGKPKIEFESMVYDFGQVGPGQKMNGRFTFTNTGDAPLKITKVQKCCGAVTKLDKEDLAPGESGVLHVTYTASRMAGAMSKKLYVESNDEQTPKAMLTIKSETVLRVDYQPKSLRLLLKDEDVVCPKITLTGTGNQPFSITRFRSTGNALIAEIDPAVEATKFILQPKADMEKGQKGRVGRINIGLAFSGAGAPTETVSIMYQILSRFSINPSTLIMLYSDASQPVKKSLWITNNYGEEFEVESASSKDGLIKILSQSKVGNRVKFELEINPPQGQDIKRFSDTFTINLKDGETLEVSCRGIYRAPKPQAGQ